MEIYLNNDILAVYEASAIHCSGLILWKECVDQILGRPRNLPLPPPGFNFFRSRFPGRQEERGDRGAAGRGSGRWDPSPAAPGRLGAAGGAAWAQEAFERGGGGLSKPPPPLIDP